MTRACVLLLLLTGCTEDVPAPAPPPPAPAAKALLSPPPAPVLIDLSNDAIVVQATCVHDCPDEDGEVSADIDIDGADDLPDVQDRCPDPPDDTDGDGDSDGCPEPAPAA